MNDDDIRRLLDLRAEVKISAPYPLALRHTLSAFHKACCNMAVPLAEEVLRLRQRTKIDTYTLGVIADSLDEAKVPKGEHDLLEERVDLLIEERDRLRTALRALVGAINSNPNSLIVDGEVFKALQAASEVCDG